MGVTARAAVEAPEGERAPYGAQPRSRWVAQTAYTCLRYINKRRRLLMLRDKWLACAFRRFASLLGGDDSLNGVVVGKARALSRREKDVAYPPPRSGTKRGRGTMRSMVEGASGD